MSWRAKAIAPALLVAFVVGVWGSHAASQPAPCPAAPFGEKRVALIIGNGAYGGSLGISAPIEDAKGVADILCKGGFQGAEKPQYDLSAVELRRELKRLGEAAKDADQVVFYYSGHGAEFEGLSSLLGVEWAGESLAASTAVSVDEVKRALSASPTAAKIMIIDACRTSPAGPLGNNDSAYKGSDEFGNVAQLFAAKPGKTSSTAGVGGRSLFTSFLVDQMAVDGVTWSGLFDSLFEAMLTTGVISQQMPERIGFVRPKYSLGLAQDRLSVPAGTPVLKSLSIDIPADLAVDYRANLLFWRKSPDDAVARSDAEAYFLDALNQASMGTAEFMAGSVEMMRRAAEMDYIEALNYLGYSYATGKGVPTNYAKAVEYWQKAANNGSSAAMVNLGVAYRDGWVDDAAGQREADKLAVYWFERARAKGLAVASSDLAWMYKEGRVEPRPYPLDQRLALARSLLEAAAAAGDLPGMAELGQMLLASEGGPSDIPRALDLLGRAAAGNDASALIVLADRSLKEGTAASTGKGIALLERAVLTGSPAAEFRLALRLAPTDRERARALLKSASDAGYKRATSALFAMKQGE